MKINNLARTIFVLCLLAVIIVSQIFYDKARVRSKAVKIPPISSNFIKTLDLGLHSGAASLYWVNETMGELVYLGSGMENYKKEFALVNELDPKFSFPYYWVLLVLPRDSRPETIDAAIEIGERGALQADPDWRVSFYLATLYLLYKNDYANAAKYFDQAVKMPDIPPILKRFSQNYGITSKLRDKTKQVWMTIYENSNSDETTKEKAKNYIVRLEEFDYLESMVNVYKQKFGRWPDKIEDLISGGIIKALPIDPLGYQFSLHPNGQVGIKQ